MSNHNSSLVAELAAMKQKVAEDAQRITELASERDDLHRRCAGFAAGPVADPATVEARCADVLRSTADRYNAVIAERDKAWEIQMLELMSKNDYLEQIINHNMDAMAGGADPNGPSVEEVHENDWSGPAFLDGLAARTGVDLPSVNNLPRAVTSSGNRTGGGQGQQPPNQRERPSGNDGAGGSPSGPPGGGPGEYNIASDGEEADGEAEDVSTEHAAKVTTALFHSKSYEKVNAPKFPSAANCMNWMIQLTTNLTMAGGYTDQAEVQWLKEVRTKTFEELADGGSERMRKADLALAKALQGLVNSTNEPLKKDLARKQTAMFNEGK